MVQGTGDRTQVFKVYDEGALLSDKIQRSRCGWRRRAATATKRHASWTPSLVNFKFLRLYQLPVKRRREGAPAGCRRRRRREEEHGGAAVEYLLVTTFATLLSVAALGYIGSLMKERLSALAARLGSSAEVPDFQLLDGDPSP